MDIVTGLDALNDFGPALAVISSAKNVRRTILLEIILHGNVSSTGLMRRSIDQTHPSKIRHARRRHFRPMFTFVARNEDHAVIGAGPDRSPLQPRRRDREDRREYFRPIHVSGDWSTRWAQCLWFRSRQVRTNAAPALSVISRLPQVLGRNVKRLWIQRRKDDRKGPLPTLFQGAGGFTREKSGIRLNVPSFAIASIIAGDQCTLAARIKNVCIDRARRDVTTLAATDVIHFAAARACLPTLDTNGAVILLGAANLVREILRRCHMIKLSGWKILGGPGRAPIHRNVSPAIVAIDHALGIIGIDQEIMIVAMRWANRAIGLAAIG